MLCVGALPTLSVGEGWEQSGYALTDEVGRPLHPEDFSTALDTLTRAAGLRRVRLHDLRDTAASLMLAAGEKVKVVSEMLGHSSPTITQNMYQHVMPPACQKAREILSAGLLT